MLVCLLIPFRWQLMPKFFLVKELEIMDDLTATNKVVLASLGGIPKLRESSTADVYGSERRFSEKRLGVPRQRAGNYHY